jgi:hypothetical protein
MKEKIEKEKKKEKEEAEKGRKQGEWLRDWERVAEKHAPRGQRGTHE